MHERGRGIWNLPNFLTLLRMLMLPLFWWLMLSADKPVIALCVYILASITDVLDGYIARRNNMVTDFGKLFDPLADKLMVISVMLALLLRGMLTPAPVLILIVKEFIMIAGGALMLKQGLVVFSHPIGKIAQFMLVCSLALCFFSDSFTVIPVHMIFLWASIALSMFAMVHYIIQAVKELSKRH